jgi:hypothetical protein
VWIDRGFGLLAIAFDVLPGDPLRAIPQAGGYVFGDELQLWHDDYGLLAGVVRSYVPVAIVSPGHTGFLCSFLVGADRLLGIPRR